ncbi:MAG: BatA domain-containing protein, partial [Planctomycetia bacterium]|nr:BatA domain-containing protein [Planctomycetia bacterium]
MSFLQIGFLAALVALAIPIIIHLVFRPRARRASLGTLRFLQLVLAQHARRRRLMHWLLLGLRLATLALIAFLFARPYWMADSLSDKRTTVLLIDQSASMNLRLDGDRLIDRAIASARKLVADARPNEQFQIALFDHAVHPLALAEESGKASDNSAGF